MEKVVIIGTGCAGLTAAIYATRVRLTCKILLMNKNFHSSGAMMVATVLVNIFPLNGHTVSDRSIFT